VRPLSLLLLCVLSIYISARSEARDYLLGDWRGNRQALAQSGIEPGLVYTVEYAKPSAGGGDNSAVVMGNVDLTLLIDAEKRLDWQGAKFFLYVLGNHHHTSGNGEFLTDKIGNAQVTSNIEAPTAAKIYELWYDQAFFPVQSGQTWSLRIGLYDLNSEFDVVESAGGLINSSFGIGPDFSQSGENGPSIFPTTSLALRLRYAAHNGVYAQFALLDGVPGDPNDEHGTHVHLGDGDGVLQVFETGLKQDAEVAQHFRKIAAGVWRYNPQQAEIAGDEDVYDGADTRTAHNLGYYVIGEYQLLQESADAAQGLCIFLRHGQANDNINAIATFTGAGVSYLGLLPGREADQLSIGFAVVSFGDAFINAERAAGNDAVRDERVYEISYRLRLSPWFVLQPDLQLVRDPVAGGDDVTLALLRAEIVF